jgi:hypothetical protein
MSTEIQLQRFTPVELGSVGGFRYRWNPELRRVEFLCLGEWSESDNSDSLVEGDYEEGVPTDIALMSWEDQGYKLRERLVQHGIDYLDTEES